MRAVAAAFVCAAATLAALSCKSSTYSLSVDLRTDYAPGSELALVRTTALAGGDEQRTDHLLQFSEKHCGSSGTSCSGTFPDCCGSKCLSKQQSEMNCGGCGNRVQRDEADLLQRNVPRELSVGTLRGPAGRPHSDSPPGWASNSTTGERMDATAASQPDFRSLFESLPGLYLVVEPDAPKYTVVAVSDAYLRATRTKREEIVGRGLFESYPDKPSDPRANAVSNQAVSLEEVIRTRATDTRGAERHDLRRPPEEGSGFEERWWSQVNSPVFGPSGELTHIIHRIEDVTELEKANRALRRMNEESVRLVADAPDAVFVADVTGRYTSVNEAACRMLGYTRDELIGKTILDLIPGEDTARLSRSRQDLLARGAELSEWRLRRKDGSYVPVEVNAKILRDGRWQAFVRDLSERKRLERELQETDSDLNRAQAVAQIGSWRLDIHRNVLWWSDENYRIFGVPRGTQMTYEAFLACVHPDDRAYVDREWNAALRGAPYDIEHRLLIDCQVKWVREKADLEFDAGKLLGGVGITQDITARRHLEDEERRAQDHLRETTERLEFALEGGQLASWDWNVTTGQVIFNPRWATIRGFRADEVRPHVDEWIEGIHPDDVERVQKLLSEHFAGITEVYRAEHRIRTKSGDWLWIFDVGKVFARDEQGHPVRMVGVEMDITDRKRLEDELRLAEAKSSGLLAISADAIISIDEDQRITLFNEGAERIFGYAKSEVLGASLGVLLPERLRAIHRQHVAGFTASPVASRRMGERGIEILGRRKNGEEFPADASLSKLELGGKRILTVAVRDVTEQQRTERDQRLLAEVGAVFSSTLDYEATLTTIARSVVRELADLCIVDLIEEGETRPLTVLTRDPEKARLSEGIRALHAVRARPVFAEQVLSTRQPLLIENLAPDKYGSLASRGDHLRMLRVIDPRSLMSVPLQAHGRLLGLMTFMSTEASRVYRPADLRLAEEIAHRASLAIENARLYRAAGRAVQTRDEVLGIVAHDLRNPLGAILMNASLVQRQQPQSAPCWKPAESIQRAANRMNRMIQDLLDVTRMEAGRLTVERRETRTTQLIADALEAQRANAAAASVELRPVVSGEIPDILADRDRLLQVFENLIGNALKFTGRGGVVSVAAKPRDGEVVFSVSDTGAGIAADELPHVFDRFWQAHSARRRGVGLGLAIVKGIVEQHGGRVWVDSEAGRGSTFSFAIPTTERVVARRASVVPDRPSVNP